jgi:tetratricopeptide (TPR) repeat protein
VTIDLPTLWSFPRFASPPFPLILERNHNMKNLAHLLLFLAFSLTFMFGQQKSDLSKQGDPFDLSRSREKIGKFGLPTVTRVADLENKARVLYAANNWREAGIALDRFAREANTLANLISSGLEPYYGASYDDKENIKGLGALAAYEKLANDYKTKRDRAMVMQAECLILTGQKEEAAALLLRALDTISADDRDWWDRARNKLYALIDVR